MGELRVTVSLVFCRHLRGVRRELAFSASFLNCLVFALEAHPFAVIHEKRDQICKSDLSILLAQLMYFLRKVPQCLLCFLFFVFFLIIVCKNVKKIETMETSF